MGYTLGVEYNTGRVWECDIDGSIRWEIRDLDGPMDAQVLPNDRVLIAEADAHRVTERDFKGKVLWEQKIDGEPNGCQRLANGNTFVFTYDHAVTSNSSRAMELRPDGSTIYSIQLGPGTVGSNAVRKSHNGHIIYALNKTIGEVDTARAHVRWISLPAEESGYVDVQELPGDRFLVTHMGRGCVLEVDGVGKVLWQADVPGACRATRLPNGHTLVSANHRVVELRLDGGKVWEKETSGYPRRVYRR